jgi:hypothetical protein
MLVIAASCRIRRRPISDSVADFQLLPVGGGRGDHKFQLLLTLVGQGLPGGCDHLIWPHLELF